MDGQGKPLVIRIKPASIDDARFPMGIVRVSTEETITYLNRATREMVGPGVDVGHRLEALPFDTGGRAALRTALDERFESERASEYVLCLSHRERGTPVRLRIAAVPEYDADGCLTGSIGLLSDESVEEASIAIHRSIQSADSASTLYAELDRHLRDVVSYHTMLVTCISRGRGHLRNAYENPPPSRQLRPTQWWPMQPFNKAMLDQFVAGPVDLAALFAMPEFIEYARRDASVAEWRDRGYRHALQLGVQSGGTLVATLMLLRTDDRAFTEEDNERCRHLPVGEAVHAALGLDERARLRFRLDLLDAIAEKADSVEQVARHLVDKLKGHFGWEHVSLFRVDEDQRRLRMLCQAGEAMHLLPEGYVQAFGTGLIGRAFRDQVLVNEGDVTEASAAGDYLEGIPGTRSEMVLPVPGSRLRWLLNVESTRRDAFADEEPGLVGQLLRVAGIVLDRTATLELKDAILGAVADGVLQTDAMGVVRSANPAALRLLGRPLAQLQDRHLESFVGTPAEIRFGDDEVEVGEQGAWQATPTSVAAPGVDGGWGASTDWTPRPMHLVRADGRLVPVLMSSATLPSEVGGRVFVVSDLTEHARARRMESLKEVFLQLCAEIRTPLSLASTFLEDAIGHPDRFDLFVQKAVRQIGQADLSLERVVRLAAASEDAALPRVVFDLRAAVTDLVDQGLGDEVVLTPATGAADGMLLVHAARHELLFCLQTLVAHLLSVKSQVEHVRIVLSRHGARVYAFVDLQAPAGVVVSPRPGPDDAVGRELALAEPLLSALMARMGGSYSAHGGAQPRFRVVIEAGD